MFKRATIVTAFLLLASISLMAGTSPSPGGPTDKPLYAPERRDFQRLLLEDGKPSTVQAKWTRTGTTARRNPARPSP
jgi:hypothetical protein